MFSHSGSGLQLRFWKCRKDKYQQTKAFNIQNMDCFLTTSSHLYFIQKQWMKTAQCNTAAAFLPKPMFFSF